MQYAIVVVGGGGGGGLPYAMHCGGPLLQKVADSPKLRKAHKFLSVTDKSKADVVIFWWSVVGAYLYGAGSM